MGRGGNSVKKALTYLVKERVDRPKSEDENEIEKKLDVFYLLFALSAGQVLRFVFLLLFHSFPFAVASWRRALIPE